MNIFTTFRDNFAWDCIYSTELHSILVTSWLIVNVQQSDFPLILKQFVKMPSNRILFKNAAVVSMDPSIGIPEKCDVLVDGNMISKIAQNITEDPETKIIDASHAIIAPGFVDAHHHLWQQLLKGVATDWTLADYMATMRRLYGSLFTAEDVYVADFAACLDLIANGITTVIDHCRKFLFF